MNESVEFGFRAVAVAREGSVTRASELLHLSQPAVSAHIKAVEDVLALTLFDRTSRGMTLTADGQRLLVKAERTLQAHQQLMEEAARIKGPLGGKLRLGAGSNTDDAAVGRLLTTPSAPLDWPALAEQPWIYPAASACCSKAAESLFEAHHIRPRASSASIGKTSRAR